MRNLILNKYEMMWLFIFFDLPVTEKEERKEAADFRNFLLDNGFSMTQYSVYIRVFSGKDACEKYYKLIGANLPAGGKVDILMVTDRQYSNIVSFRGRKKVKQKARNQLLLF